MILNIEQRPGKLIISYINKEGLISFMQLNVPTQHQYSYVLAKGRSQPGVMSWNNKPVVKIPAEFLDPHRIQEFFIEAGEDIIAPLFEMNLPQMYCWDIETDVTDDGFAEASDAKNRINTMSWVHYPDVTCFGLKPLSGEQCQAIEDNINEHVKKFNKKYKFIYKCYNNEADMLYDWGYNYAREAPLITGWNIWGYDWRYYANRCKRLNIDISWMSPTSQWGPFTIVEKQKKVKIMLPHHKLIVDYMTIYKKWDRSIEVKENDTLEFVSDAALGISKVKYPGTFQDLYNKDYDKHVFYNAIDSVLVELSNDHLKTMGIFLGLGNLTMVQAMQAFSPISMLEATLTRYAYKRNKIFPKVRNEATRDEYEGAFVFEPTPGLYPWVASFDFASLYPTIMRQFEISVENFITKDKNFKTNEHQIKCVSGAVFDASTEPLLSEILSNYYSERKESKKISQLAEKEAAELKIILNKRKSNSQASLVKEI